MVGLLFLVRDFCFFCLDWFWILLFSLTLKVLKKTPSLFAILVEVEVLTSFYLFAPLPCACEKSHSGGLFVEFCSVGWGWKFGC